VNQGVHDIRRPRREQRSRRASAPRRAAGCSGIRHDRPRP
jgi:hypothetical protein